MPRLPGLLIDSKTPTSSHQVGGLAYHPTTHTGPHTTAHTKQRRPQAQRRATTAQATQHRNARPPSPRREDTDMARRRCSHPGCPALIPHPGPRLCPTHSREREQQRGYSTARGYNRHYRAARVRAARLVEAGQAVCWRCGQPIKADEAFDLGHDDEDRSIIRGPEHVFCNRSAAGKAAHKYDRTDTN